MSTALLKFKPPASAPKETPLDSGMLTAALDGSPEPFALTENGKLIYSNPSFAQLSSQSEANPAAGSPGTAWRSTAVAVGARTFSLTTLRRDPSPTPASEATHLEAMGRLVNGVAHDFNNVLTGILLYCDLLKTKLPSGNSLAVKVEEIRRAADQGAGLVRQLMTFGREEKDAPRQISFNQALRETLPLLQHLAGEHVAITLELAGAEPQVALSLAQAQQIILNLALNARDSMPGGGRIALETRLREFGPAASRLPAFEFTVTDSGAGMDADTAARIFDPFFTTKAAGSGTGLGLATVKRIVEQAGGMISVDSIPGDGTRMTLRLPQVEQVSPEGDDPILAETLPRRHPRRSEIPKSQSHSSENRGADA